MAITGPHIRITHRFVWLDQEMSTVRHYRPEGAALLTVEPVDVAEAYWNHIKLTWRALVGDTNNYGMRSMLIEELGGNQGFAEFAIPVGEQTGTRAVAGLGELLPSFLAVGVRFSVGTRRTRPGQMRIPFLWEADVSANVVGAGFMALVDAHAQVMAAAMVLGAPAALVALNPEVVSYSPDDPSVIVDSQDIVGFVSSNIATSQRSRRQGIGR